MRCETTADAGAFWERVSGFLLADPLVNSVLVTNVLARAAGTITDPAPATYAAVIDDSGSVAGAAMRTPPHAIYVSPMPPEAVEPLAGALAVSCPDAGGVAGTAAEAEAFASAWARRTGAVPTVEMRQRIYRLDAVIAPVAPPGEWLAAGASERDLLVEWSLAFDIETGMAVTGDSRRQRGADLDARLAQGRAFVWIDGEPVAYAGVTAPVGGIVRVGPVYTPPPRRRRGYASALVAAVSRLALERGAVACSLYTDLANPTSNRIYMAVGYRPVCDVMVYAFSSRDL
jgi:predicted GNAT family acetyltransferase